MSNLKITAISLPKDVHRRIKARAKEAGFERSLSAYFVKLAREDLAKEKEKVVA